MARALLCLAAAAAAAAAVGDALPTFNFRAYAATAHEGAITAYTADGSVLANATLRMNLTAVGPHVVEGPITIAPLGVLAALLPAPARLRLVFNIGSNCSGTVFVALENDNDAAAAAAAAAAEYEDLTGSGASSGSSSGDGGWEQVATFDWRTTAHGVAVDADSAALIVHDGAGNAAVATAAFGSAAPSLHLAWRAAPDGSTRVSVVATRRPPLPARTFWSQYGTMLTVVVMISLNVGLKWFGASGTGRTLASAGRRAAANRGAAAAAAAAAASAGTSATSTAAPVSSASRSGSGDDDAGDDGGVRGGDAGGDDDAAYERGAPIDLSAAAAAAATLSAARDGDAPASSKKDD